MSEIAIRAEGLSKQYQIGARQERYRTLRETVAGVLSRRGAPKRVGKKETVWALNEVSFEVRRGEVVGIIGRNGAGKSTLLKTLSRITEPSAGYADIYGRVGSLLEVGTGFHPELTGRENIYLNGAILGMRRSEIARQFDEIVAFAEVEKFVDTPVKHYSSGMYLRLAFAVAAHLESEVLLVDEVLAVGDIAFQKKCLGKMADVSREGRTVLLVSHNMAAIHSLARRCFLISGGRLIHDGSVADGISAYNNSFEDLPTGSTSGRHGAIRLLGPNSRRWDGSRQFHLDWEVSLEAMTPSAIIWCIVTDSNGARMLQEYNTYADPHAPDHGSKSWRIRVSMPPVWLKPGMYMVQLRVLPHGLGVKRYHSDPLPFEITSPRTSFAEAALAPEVRWELKSSAVAKSSTVIG
jgi:lipopolysaccharide transport system ATP-binding protein